MTENEQNPLEHWGDLSDEQRTALLEMARSRIFWKQLGTRMQWLKGVASIVLTLLAAWTILGDTVAQWINAKQ